MTAITPNNKIRAMERYANLRATEIANTRLSLQEEAKKREQEAYIKDEGRSYEYVRSILDHE